MANVHIAAGKLDVTTVQIHYDFQLVSLYLKVNTVYCGRNPVHYCKWSTV